MGPGVATVALLANVSFWPMLWRRERAETHTVSRAHVLAFESWVPNVLSCQTMTDRCLASLGHDRATRGASLWPGHPPRATRPENPTDLIVSGHHNLCINRWSRRAAPRAPRPFAGQTATSDAATPALSRGTARRFPQRSWRHGGPTAHAQRRLQPGGYHRLGRFQRVWWDRPDATD